jgi:phosphate:Na+ symporter
MTGLFFAERAGVPLVFAAVKHADGDGKLQLALIFLISNLFPAILMSFAIGPIMRQLEKWLPGESSAALAQPKYLSDSALSDPATGIELMAKELSRLLVAVHVRPEQAQLGEDGEPEGDPAFGQLSATIEQFGARLASQNEITEKDAHFLHLLRAELSLIRYFEDAVREFNDALYAVHAKPPLKEASYILQHGLHELIRSARRAAEEQSAETVENLRGQTKRHGEFVKAQVDRAKALSPAPEIAALSDAFELAAWMLHRLSKVLDQFVGERVTPAPQKSAAGQG